MRDASRIWRCALVFFLHFACWCCWEQFFNCKYEPWQLVPVQSLINDHKPCTNTKPYHAPEVFNSLYTKIHAWHMTIVWWNNMRNSCVITLYFNLNLHLSWTPKTSIQFHGCLRGKTSLVWETKLLEVHLKLVYWNYLLLWTSPTSCATLTHISSHRHLS